MSLLFEGRSEQRRLRTSLPGVDHTGTARQVYQSMLEHQIAPTLRAWGLAGAGERYDYPSRVWHLSLAFVPAAWNTASRFQFDINVVAVTRVEWEQWRASEPSLPEAPDASLYYAHNFVLGGGLMARLGELQREGLDRRWTVHSGIDPTPVAAQVLAGLKAAVVPQFVGRAEARSQPA